MITLETYLNLHHDVIEYAVKVNEASEKKYVNYPDAEKIVLSRGCLFKIGESAVILHRAVLSICMEGWSSVSPILLRSMIDLGANSFAIINGRHNSEYMAFKYFATDYLNQIIDENYRPNYDSNTEQINNLIDKLDNEVKKKAIEYAESVKKEKKRIRYWFNPEYPGVKHIIDNTLLYELFQIYSGSSHGSYLGMQIFKDKPDFYESVIKFV